MIQEFICIIGSERDHSRQSNIANFSLKKHRQSNFALVQFLRIRAMGCRINLYFLSTGSCEISTEVLRRRTCEKSWESIIYAWIQFKIWFQTALLLKTMYKLGSGPFFLWTTFGAICANIRVIYCS